MKGKNNVHIPSGVAYIKLSFSDIIISIKDNLGNLLSCSSASLLGFSGSKKSSAIAAGKVASIVACSAKDQGLKKVSVIIKGAGIGRQSAIRAIQDAGLEITTIKDLSPLHHNGFRPPKKKRYQRIICNLQ